MEFLEVKVASSWVIPFPEGILGRNHIVV